MRSPRWRWSPCTRRAIARRRSSAQDPLADNTDVYAFVSPNSPDRVTLIANFIPFEAPYGGPNFFKFDDNVLYEIMVDNDGDAVEDVTFQFRFRTEVRNPNTFLYNTGPITSLDSTTFNVRQFYTVTRVDGPRRRGRGTVLATDLPTPPVNVGFRSTPNYEALAAAAVRPLPGGAQVFAGQRDDPFFVDLNVFDLLAVPPADIEELRRARRLQRALDRDRGADRVAHRQRRAADIGQPIPTRSSASGPPRAGHR